MVAHKSTVSLTVEHLESRTNPAPLLTVTAEQAAAVHALAQQAIAGDPAVAAHRVTLPADADERICIALDLTPDDAAGIWDGENALLLLERDYSAPDGSYKLGLDGTGWTSGSGDNAQAFSEVYAGMLWHSHVVELTTVPELNGTIVVQQAFADALLAAQLGDQFEGSGLLLDGLKISPASLAVQQPDGSLTLQLAVPLATGWQVQTLTQQPGGLWTLTESAFAGTLTPALGLWQLAIAG